MAGRLRFHGRLVLDVYHRGFFEHNSGVRTLEIAGQVIRERSELRERRLRVWLGNDDVFDWRLYTPDELATEGARAGLTPLLACTTWDESRPPSAEEARMHLVFERVNEQEQPAGLVDAGLV